MHRRLSSSVVAARHHTSALGSDSHVTACTTVLGVIATTLFKPAMQLSLAVHMLWPDLSLWISTMTKCYGLT